jgi:hypothetical protein
MTPCPICEANRADLGRPSAARWIGPDGNVYCSMHFVNRFGHSERLVKIEGFAAPKKAKAPAKRKKKEEVA